MGSGPHWRRSPAIPPIVYAPADPLLIGYARGWSLSEPYLLRARPPCGDTQTGPAAGGNPRLPLQAIDERVGELLRVRGPQLPSFLPRSSRSA